MKEVKKKILIIINPISGSAHREYMPVIVENNLDKELFSHVVRFTQGPGHATQLAKAAIEQGFYGVIAIGGDGTINETASALINSQVALGIVPCGSGNGLARHLNIPIVPERALKIINENHIEDLDYCTVNDVPFFCTCGVGFDAAVSEKFSQAKKRGPLSYAKNAILEYLNYRSEEYIIKTPESETTEQAFVIACGNASQYGNNAFIAPKASMQDGMIDVTVIHPFKPIETPLIGLQLFTKQIDKNTNIHCFRTSELSIFRPKAAVMHIDGEPIMMAANLNIKCHKSGIKVFTPTGANRSILEPIENGFYDFVNAIRSELDI
ncbi:MAG: diacylglycerol/lipid kinase family protein [Muribaculaceae bacterium]